MSATTALFRVSLIGASLGTFLLTAPSGAQEMDHSTMHMPPAETPASAPPAQKKKATPPATETQAGHGAATTAPAPAKEPQPVDHAAMGHTAPAPTSDEEHPMDHAAMGHDMEGMSMPLTEPRTPIPPITDADRAAATPPPHDHPAHDNTIQSFVLFDRLEASNGDRGTDLEWEGQSWIGTDRNRLWLRSEGERVNGRTGKADLEVLYGHSVSTWWDVVAGVRHDFKPGQAQDFAAIGVIGLAPHKFEVAATAYVGQSGQTAARLEAEYELLLTNRLILQPLVEINAFGKTDADRGIGSGLSTLEAGLRLRYEITRQFAPYIGIVREHAFGRTADFRRAEGDDINDTRLVAGLRIWF